MKKFIIRTLGVSILCLLVCSVFSIYSFYKVRKHTTFVFPKDKHTIVIGDSHTECSIDDAILSNWKNYSSSGMHYFYINIMLKKMLLENPQIDSVILSARPTSFIAMNEKTDNKTLDHKWLYDKSTIDIRKSFLYFLTLDELKDACQKVPYMLFSLFRPEDIPAIYTKSTITQGDLGMTGGYLYLDQNNLHIYIDKHRKKKKNQLMPYKADMQIKYFMQIVALCKQKGCTLILLDTPENAWDANAVKYRDVDKFREIFPDCKDTLYIADYHDYQLPDSCYADATHLNYHGARAFSKNIKENGLIITDTIYPIKSK